MNISSLPRPMQHPTGPSQSAHPSSLITRMSSDIRLLKSEGRQLHFRDVMVEGVLDSSITQFSAPAQKHVQRHSSFNRTVTEEVTRNSDFSQIFETRRPEMYQSSVSQLLKGNQFKSDGEESQRLKNDLVRCKAELIVKNERISYLESICAKHLKELQAVKNRQQSQPFQMKIAELESKLASKDIQIQHYECRIEAMEDTRRIIDDQRVLLVKMETSISQLSNEKKSLMEQLAEQTHKMETMKKQSARKDEKSQVMVLEQQIQRLGEAKDHTEGLHMAHIRRLGQALDEANSTTARYMLTQLNRKYLKSMIIC